MTINGINTIFRNQYEMKKKRIQVEITSKISKYTTIEKLLKYVSTNLTRKLSLNRSVKPITIEMT